MNKPLIAIISDIVENNEEIFFVNTTYPKAIEESGGIPLILPYNKDFKQILGLVKGILLVGGGIYYKNKIIYHYKPLSETNPKRYNYESIIIKFAIKHKIPLLGICRGAQTICECVGGEIENKPSSLVLKNHQNNFHEILVKKNTLLWNFMKQKRVKVNSLHQKIMIKIPLPYVVSAKSPEGTIEAFELNYPFVMGLQFHPERMLNDSIAFKNIFQNFINICKLNNTK